jgi:putative protein kinase ArgK-like GTPase of G3E family
VLEVADVLVVNKADRPETQATVRDLRTMVSLAQAGWRPPIVTTIATANEGVASGGLGPHEAAAELLAAAAPRPPPRA